MNTLKGKYTPQNPHKYKGNLSKIVYRSSYELRFMRFCDLRDDILEWSSEEVIIPYRHPVDGRVHRYFPDFKVKVKTKEGNIETWIIEIKPEKQTIPPRIQQRRTKRYLNEVKTYAINTNKWKYARDWCESRGYKFEIFTEKNLGL